MSVKIRKVVELHFTLTKITPTNGVIFMCARGWRRFENFVLYKKKNRQRDRWRSSGGVPASLVQGVIGPRPILDATSQP